MKPILVLYATRHGLARRVAERLAARLREGGEQPDIVDVRKVAPESLDLGRYRTALLVSSVQIGKLQPEMVAFGRRHHEALAAMHAVLFSVCMSAAGLARPDLLPEERRKKLAIAQKPIDAFTSATGWMPSEVHLVAGALNYREYGFFLRMIMRFISKQAGDPIDTSKNHEFTDWAALDRAADGLLVSAAA